ncbi:acetyl-CoA carboxylase biotin carboxyl carrier protein [Streptomyces sp. NBC_00258]|uniref:acetyl-CoA carboxylase biotin carboxyl carrier protein n=1 Tax=Streptomyces sp. NBC_00258 TaxID=2903642 RepID=UPI002E2D5668|nr:biotin/lipoyl-containing protein [Streptomyces sp. NBC_00258]
MSTPDSVATLDGLMNDGRPDTLPSVLEAAKASMIELLSQAPFPPSAVRVTVGPVTIEMDWPGTAPDAGTALEARVVPAPAQTMPTPGDGPVLDHIHAPTVGVFYRAPEPGAKPFVSEGDTVVPGQQVGLVEAMKLMIPVESDRQGTIEEFLQPNGALVEYGDPLCSFVPADGR